MTTAPVWFPSEDYMKKTRLFQWMNELGYKDYDDFYEQSIHDVEGFWREAEKALDIEWFTAYKHTLNLSKGIKWPQWFVGGKTNVVHNAVNKWAHSSDSDDQTALIWESDDGKTISYTFKQLSDSVNAAAAGLKASGIRKGDVITIYMPMIPETVIAILAAAKIGAIFSPAFSGYGADAVALRMNASESKMLITADGFMRRGKQVLMKNEADAAASQCPSLEKVIVVERLGLDVTWDNEKDLSWKDMLQRGNSTAVETMQMDSSDPLMLIYTSGTTGKPKGAVHTHTGFPIKAAFDAGLAMDVKKADTLFWYTDMGWMMGPFLVFGGLLNGATIVLFEGTPDFPNPDRLWELVEKHQVTHLGISPTLIRSLMKHGTSWINKHDLSTLKLIGSTGEPWNPEPWKWLFEHVGKSKVPIFNYSGGTEISGGILGNVLLKPIGPITFNSPLPGMAACVYDEDGKSVTNKVGELVIRKPWVGMTNGFWHEPERYEAAYWSRFTDTWVHGDWVIKDDDGYWTITGRSDDILNVAGKRLGPAEIESLLVDHSAVIEAAVIGVPDEVKGEAAVCFAVINKDFKADETLNSDLLNLIGEKLGKPMRPKAIHFVSELPKTRNGKVIRRAIKSAYTSQPSGDLSSLENTQSVEEIKKLGNQVTASEPEKPRT